MAKTPLPRRIIKDDGKAMAVGLVTFAVGAYLLYDAAEGRGHQLPWPFSIATPW